MAATLYYTPTSCGAASYIAAFKAGLIESGKVVAFEADIREKKIVTGPRKGEDFRTVNPKGNVPALVLADGTLLNEGAAVLQYIADLAPEAKLAAANGTTERYLLQNVLNFLGTEIHSNFGPLFYPGLTEEGKAAQRAKLLGKLEWLAKTELADGAKEYLVGGSFTVADSYLYIILTWAPYVQVSLESVPVLAAFRDRIASLDFVKGAHAAMAAASKESA